MTIPGEIITATTVLIPLCAVSWYFFRRWAERLEGEIKYISVKIDSIMDQRAECRATLISREEYSHGMARMHQRLDEHIAVTADLASRVARIEGGQ